MTGVRSDNASSTALCNRLGVHDTAYAHATCVDVDTPGRKSITKQGSAFFQRIAEAMNDIGEA